MTRLLPLPKISPGTVVYFQGRWKCRVISDQGNSLTYVAMEGYEPSYMGTELSAEKGLFTSDPA